VRKGQVFSKGPERTLLGGAALRVNTGRAAVGLPAQAVKRRQTGVNVAQLFMI